MWVEFLGGVGSGKSSLATALKERFKIAGVSVSSPQQAFDIRLAQFLPQAIQYRRAGYGARRALLTGWQARFSLKHPSLVWQAWNTSQKLRNLPGWHRRIIFNLFLEVAGWYEGLSSAAPPHSMVVVDEGLAHRAINLFAWQTGVLDTKGIRTYLEKLPQIPLTFLVSAPIQVCLERAYSRGLPIRLQGKDPQTIRRFIENSHTVASLAGEILTSNGKVVIKIENSSDLEQSVAIIYKQITETLLSQKDNTKSYPSSFLQAAEDETR